MKIDEIIATDLKELFGEEDQARVGSPHGLMSSGKSGTTVLPLPYHEAMLSLPDLEANNPYNRLITAIEMVELKKESNEIHQWCNLCPEFIIPIGDGLKLFLSCEGSASCKTSRYLIRYRRSSIWVLIRDIADAADQADLQLVWTSPVSLCPCTGDDCPVWVLLSLLWTPGLPGRGRPCR